MIMGPPDMKIIKEHKFKNKSSEKIDLHGIRLIVATLIKSNMLMYIKEPYILNRIVFS